MANLQELSSVLKALNEESDQTNKILAEFESKINAMNAGVEAWVVSDELDVRIFTKPDQDEEKEDWRFREDVLLGFGKWHDKYQLLFKSDTYRHNGTDDWEPWDLWDEGDPRPLLQAPRDYRLKAMGLLEKLVDAILEEANKRRNTFSVGKKVVDNL
jgi:hypothetical protein